MIKNTTISQTLDIAADKIRYDEACKKLLSEKIILAWIMKTCLNEYRNLEVEEIASRYIEGIPEIGKAPLPQDLANTPQIRQMGTEDINIAAQKIFYDIRFSAITQKMEKNEFMRLLINVEAQNDYYPGYPLIKRAIYYSSRMIVSQSGTEFTQSHFENIRKVYSIWLCMNPPLNRQKTITRYFIQESNIYGQMTEEPEKYDLLNVIMICLGEPSEEANPNATQEEKLIRLLEVLFSPHMKAEKKKQILRKEYDIITESIERLVDDMCNLSDGIETRGVEIGIEQGIEQGIITTCKDLGISFIDTVEHMVNKFNLTQKEAEAKVLKYW